MSSPPALRLVEASGPADTHFMLVTLVVSQPTAPWMKVAVSINVLVEGISLDERPGFEKAAASMSAFVEGSGLDENRIHTSPVTHGVTR